MKNYSLNQNTRLILVLFFFSLSIHSFAQSSTFCATDNLIRAEKPRHFSITEINTAELRSNTTLNIRTVFHIVYNTAEQNIPEADIQSILDELNDFFLATDIDTSLINPVHRSKITNSNIQFCLASEDPFGNPSNGITRTETDSVQFTLNFPNDFSAFNLLGQEQHKNDSTGGASPWDVSRYLNIWIVQTLGPNASANYGDPMPEHYPIINYFEGSRIPGITFDMDNFTSIDEFFLPANILAHECGHFLGLLHTFGFNPDSISELCGVDDEIEDTPVCNATTDCNLSSNTCEEPQGEEPDNVANFMNYGCMLMFTPDQISTMRNNILNASPGLLADENCSGITTTVVSESIFDEQAFEIFPNPNSGSFYIQLNNEVIGPEINWTIYDLRGQEIQSQIGSDINNIPQQINISITIPGIYFITLKSRTVSLTKKIIITD